MRTTITLDDDVAAAVDRIRREDGTGISDVVNRLVRTALARPPQQTPYVHESHPLGIRISVDNVAEVLDYLDEPDR